jgi:hypothetical protein
MKRIRLYNGYNNLLGARGSVVVMALCYKPEGRCEFLNVPYLPAALGLGLYTASNRNAYQKHKNNNVTGG